MSLSEFFDIERYLQARHIDYTIGRMKNVSANNLAMACPFCDDHSNHLGIRLDDKRANCWRCGKKSITQLIEKIDRVGRQAAIKILLEFQNYDTLSYSANLQSRPDTIKIPANLVPIEKSPKLPLISTFLKGRGLSPSDIYRPSYLANWPIYGPNPWHIGSWKFRLIFPIAQHGEMVNLVGRDTTNQSPTPYKALPNDQAKIPIKETLFGLDGIKKGGRIVVVEGIFDALKLSDGAVATHGITWTKSQLLLLQHKRPSRIYILFDSEPTAQESAERLAKNIWFAPTELLELETKKDPGELSIEEGNRLMKELSICP
jgi:DNA primase